MTVGERKQACLKVISEAVLYLQEHGFTSAEAGAALADVFVTGLVVAEGHVGAADALRRMAETVAQQSGGKKTIN